MEKDLTPRELKRIESDKKILDAAIRVFGEKGYGNSNLREIASVAGITQGLISQRFGTKENLFEKAIYATEVLWVDRKIPIDTPVEKALLALVQTAKKLCDRDPIIFQFVYMISSSTDIPVAIINKQREFFENSNLCKLLLKGQEEGYLAKGNIAVLFNIFLSNTFKIIRDYKKADLTFSDDKNLLVLIQYRDPDAAEHNYLKNKAFESVSQSYFSLIYFYLNKNIYRISRTTEKIEKICKKYSDLQKMVDYGCEELVDSKYRQVVSAFMDLSTIADRLENQKVIALNFMGANQERYTVSFISVNKEPDNVIVLCGLRKPVDR